MATEITILQPNTANNWLEAWPQSILTWLQYPAFYQFVSTGFEVEPGRYLHNFNPASVVIRLYINPYKKAKRAIT